MNVRFAAPIVLGIALNAEAHAAVSALLGEGQKFSNARANLVEDGWKPRATKLQMGDGTLEREFATAKSFLQAGFLEVETCTGTGLNWCIFNYVDSKGNCLRVTTTGERPKDAVVREWSHQCPAKEAL